MIRFRGSAASPGLADAPAIVISQALPELPEFSDPGVAFATAATHVSRRLKDLAGAAAAAGRHEAAEILEAQSLMADDPMLNDEVAARLQTAMPLDQAIHDAAEVVATALETSGSEYLAARADDVREIARRIIFALVGQEPQSLSEIGEPAVVVARELTAADTAAMDPVLIRGFVTEGGGPTGHVAVIARSLGIPAVVGVAGVVDAVTSGDRILLNGLTGSVIVNPDPAALAEHETAAQRHAESTAAAEQYRGQRVTVDGRPVAVAANVGGPDDVEAAVAVAADGIGLFRTEFLFLDRDVPPDEDEQLEIYRHAAGAFEDPVVIRTFDIGGDKPAPYLDLPAEENPFLGVRGARLYPLYEELALTQARALLRAATAGQVWVMAPMVATMADIDGFVRLFDRARESLARDGRGAGEVRLGVMVEVPALALNATAAAQRVQFFSIGTNDLTQYTLAADRTSGALAGYNDAADPAVLRLCSMTAAAARTAGISVSVCGEAAADPVTAALFAAMGMDKLSVGPGAVNPVKRILAELDLSSAVVALDAALAAASAADARAIVGRQLGI